MFDPYSEFFLGRRGLWQCEAHRNLVFGAVLPCRFLYSSKDVKITAAVEITLELNVNVPTGPQPFFAEMAVRETKKNGMFVIPGIGRLVRVERKARIGRNPATVNDHLKT